MKFGTPFGPSQSSSPVMEVLAIINAIVLTVLYAAVWIICGVQIVIAIL